MSPHTRMAVWLIGGGFVIGFPLGFVTAGVSYLAIRGALA